MKPKTPIPFQTTTICSLVIGALLAANLGIAPGQADTGVASAPTNVRIESGPRPAEISLTWDVPAGDGGNRVTAYRVYRGETSGQLSPLEGNVEGLGVTDTCLGHGTRWFYQVTALNAAGESARSNEVSALSGRPPDAGENVQVMGATLATPRSGTSAVWTGAKAYIFGGEEGAAGDILWYDPVADCSKWAGEELEGTYKYTSAAWDGQFAFIYGGDDPEADEPADEINRYDPASNQAELIEGLPSARYGTSAVAAGADRFVFGGATEESLVNLELAQIYNHATGEVEGDLPDPRVHTSAVWDGNHAYVFGGSLEDSPKEEIYRYAAGWADAETMEGFLPHGGIDGTSAVWDGSSAYLFGGEGPSGVLSEIQSYDPVVDQLETLSLELPGPLKFASAVWDGTHAYVFGGEDGAPLESDAILRFTPALPGERDPPRNLAAARGPGAGQVSLSWQAPDSSSGLTGYRIYRGIAAALEIFHADVGTSPSFTDSGLKEGSSWCYKLTAVFGLVEGRISNEVCAAAPERPSTPTLPLAVPGEVLGQIALQWRIPADEGGIPITGYRVYRNGALVAEPTGTSFVDAGLTWWDQESYTVSAVNGVGEGGKTLPSDAFPASPPSMPRNLAVSSAAPNELTASWQIPITNGGKALAAYRIYRTGAQGEEVWLDEIAPATTYQDPNLVPSAYTYRVTAVNAWGEGQSTLLQAAQARALTPPKLELALDPLLPQVHLNWILDAGPTPQSFEILRSMEADDHGDSVGEVGGNENAFSDHPPILGLNYYYRVKAITDLGSSLSFQERIFVPPPCGATLSCDDNPAVPNLFCGILDTADYDHDGKPDCRDPDVDGDHLENKLEDQLELDDRDPNTDDEGGRDHKDPVAGHKGFGVAVQIVEICSEKWWDGSSVLGVQWPDPFLATEAAVQTNEGGSGAIGLHINKLSRDSHFHNKKCINADYAASLAKDVRAVLDLPTGPLTDWAWSTEVGIPKLRIHFPLLDHDTFDCGVGDIHHVCSENLGGDGEMGWPSLPTDLLSLMTLRWPTDGGVDKATLNTADLGAAITIDMGNPMEFRVRLKVGINGSACDLVTWILGQGLPDADPLGEIVDIEKFKQKANELGLGGVCAVV